MKNPDRNPVLLHAIVALVSIASCVLALVMGFSWLVAGSFALSVFSAAVLVEMGRLIRSNQAKLKEFHHDAMRSIEQEGVQTRHWMGLIHLLSPRAPLPEMRGLSTRPDLLAELTREIIARKPRLILEFGTGISTLIMGYALQKAGSGRIVSLEENEPWASLSRAQVALHGLGDVVEIRSAPLANLELKGATYAWYDLKSYADLEHIDMVFVDGPYVCKNRYCALPTTVERLSPSATILTDDARDPDFSAALKRWHAEFPEFAQTEVATLRGTARLQRTSTST